jgi:hypothetical protein
MSLAHPAPPEDGAVWLAAADDALVDACPGWRERRRCIGADGQRLFHPHPPCLQAQYRHDLILIEHGLLVSSSGGRGR